MLRSTSSLPGTYMCCRVYVLPGICVAGYMCCRVPMCWEAWLCMPRSTSSLPGTYMCCRVYVLPGTYVLGSLVVHAAINVFFAGYLYVLPGICVAGYLCVGEPGCACCDQRLLCRVPICVA